MIQAHYELEVYKLGFQAAMRIFEGTKGFPGDDHSSSAIAHSEERGTRED